MADDRALLTESDLHDFQHRIIDHMVDEKRSLVVLPVGGGKTVTSTTAFKELREEGLVDRAWVLAPKRVAVDVWGRELPHWQHLRGLSVAVAVGDTKKRDRALAADADVTVVNFDVLPWFVNAVDLGPRDFLIIDELTKVKNATGVWGKLAAKLTRNLHYSTSMTGTPRPKDDLDFFNQMLVAKGPSLWGKNFYKWRKSNFTAIDEDDRIWVPRAGHSDLLNEQFARECYTVLEEDMGKAYIKPHMRYQRIALPPSIMRQHDKAMSGWIFEFRTKGGDIVKQLLANSAVGSGKARQIASGYAYDRDGRGIIIHKLKLDALRELVDSIDDQVMIAYEFLPELDAICEAFPDVQVIGDGTSDREISEIIDGWTAGTVRKIAIHPGSGGHGLNMQYGGRHLIWFTTPWSSELYKQLIGRLARQGQKRAVFVHHLLADKTVETEMVLPRVQERGDAEDRLRALIDRLQKAT